jgi:hypothetical protein
MAAFGAIVQEADDPISRAQGGSNRNPIGTETAAGQLPLSLPKSVTPPDELPMLFSVAHEMAGPVHLQRAAPWSLVSGHQS